MQRTATTNFLDTFWYQIIQNKAMPYIGASLEYICVRGI